MIRTRFAPSPTGLLHVGNVRTALINWLFAKNAGGEFMLRIDDTDTVRSKEEFTQQIKEDLIWLGMKWDLSEHQKNRLERYEEIKKMLVDKGLLYPCYETPEELDIKRKIQLGQGKPPIYDRAALNLSQEKLEQYKQEGRQPHYRFKLENSKVEWDDLVRGKTVYESMSMSDPILIRGDGSWTYMLCSVVDDIDFEISHVIRGEDHVSNTAIHIQLFKALGHKPPTFAHLPRITTKNAEISKRTGGFDIMSLRKEEEIEAMTIVNFLAKIGTSEPPSSYTSIEPIIKEFDIGKFHKSPTNYDEKDLIRINHKIISEYNFDDVSGEFKKLQLDIDAKFWEAIKHNLEKLSDAALWYKICEQDITPLIDVSDKEFLQQASSCLPTGNWDNETWSKWIAEIKNISDRKGKDLFMPIRKALTSIEHGPELKYILPLIGEQKAKLRLSGEVT